MPGLEPEPTRFDADETGTGVHERAERADRVRAATHARDDDVGIVTEYLADLSPCFVADDTLKFAHHPRKWMRTHCRTQAVVRRLAARDPRAHRLVHRVLQRRAPRLHRPDLGTE